MNVEIVSAIFDMIGVEEWKKIKSIMKSTGASYKGYANFEKVPTAFIKNSCVHNDKMRTEFLKAVIETYLSADAINLDEIPPINSENFVGVVSLMLLKDVNTDVIQNAISIVSSSFIALDYAVSQKLITKIIGSGEIYRENLDELMALCKKEHLNLSVEQLQRIIENGNRKLLFA